MYPVIVVTEVGRLPAEERWGRLIAPLEEQLGDSGLGRVLDFEAFRREADELGRCAADEVAVELRHLGYGRELVDAVLASAGVPSGPATMPARWRSYGAEEYFTSARARHGHFDPVSQMQVIVPAAEVYEDVEHQLLVVGHTGWDGIDFGYRNGLPGLWAFPVDGEFRPAADTLDELVEGWCSGRLSF
jgi:hypothetical protein